MKWVLRFLCAGIGGLLVAAGIRQYHQDWFNAVPGWLVTIVPNNFFSLFTLLAAIGPGIIQAIRSEKQATSDEQQWFAWAVPPVVVALALVNYFVNSYHNAQQSSHLTGQMERIAMAIADSELESREERKNPDWEENAAWAEAHYRSLCSAGVLEACNVLGIFHIKRDAAGRSEASSGASSDAEEFFERACNGGVAAACYNLACSYQRGEGVAQNYEKAADLYENACDKDFANACNNLGGIYKCGWGRPKNLKKARALLAMACGAREHYACYNSHGLDDPADDDDTCDFQWSPPYVTEADVSPPRTCDEKPPDNHPGDRRFLGPTCTPSR